MASDPRGDTCAATEYGATARLTMRTTLAVSAWVVCVLMLPARVSAATPQLAYWDDWTDAGGVSHLTRCTLNNFLLRSVSKQATPEWQDRQPAPARTVLINVEPPGWNGGWHENPAVQWITPLAGSWLVEAQDGSLATIGPGELVVGEDQGSRPDATRHTGHLSRNPGSVPVSLLIVQLAGLRPTGQPCRFR